MKTIKDLEEIRNRTLERINIRKEREGTRVVVGMATCGISAGARPVLKALVEEVNKRGLRDVIVSQTGCIGICEYEPVLEVYRPGEDKVTYVKMTPEKAVRVVAEHIVNGKVVTEYTIGSIKK
ncbi:MAG: (2Fe-2S) ferredoxin domain-containing protein [Clostridiales bacterium]|nr:(2Fe-2S) ferredoxin domain-containing protein [Bacillota bacterium]NLZ91579.1 (2Fe-2S) ferredoxin domain-containing protein [Clostridiales bacterium]HOC09172.1 (2Fe-2S) ferredoxin domain-containing protein [Bacillota bacterium]HQD41279.1 (2Fe-2S) ferredoxin domain-containing protein [Bacillota bacterium]